MSRSPNKFLGKFILLLALCLVINSFILQASKAETVSLLSKCINGTCHKTPNAVVISSNGSSFIVLDSGNSTTNAFLRKVEFSSGTFIDKGLIDLGNINPESTNLYLYLSADDKKALVVRKGTSKNKSILLSIDLTNNTKTEILSSQNFSSANFFDATGSKIIASLNDSTSPKLLILNASTGATEKTYNIDDAAKDIDVTKNFDKAVIAYSKKYANSAGLYDKTQDKVTRLDLAGSLLFDVDDVIIRNSFNLKGSRTALSSFNGKHVFNLLDLNNSELKTVILDNTNKGVSTSDISPDGATGITASVVNNTNTKIYKLDLRNNTIKLQGTKSLSNFLAFDVNIVPDQQKVFVLGLIGEKVKLKVFDLVNFTELNEYSVSEIKDVNRLLIEPYGRYAVKPGASDVAVVTVTPTGTTGTISGTSTNTCGNGKIDAGEECDPKFNEMQVAAGCNTTTCKLDCSKLQFAGGGGTKSCNHGLNCSAGSGASKCGCICYAI